MSKRESSWNCKPCGGPSSVPSHLCRSLGLVAQNCPSWLWDTRAVAPFLIGRPLNLAWDSPQTATWLRQQNQDTKDLRQQYQALTNSPSPVSQAGPVRPTLKKCQLLPPSTFYSLVSFPIRILQDQIYSWVHHATLPQRLRLVSEWTCHFLQYVLPISLSPAQLGFRIKVLFHCHNQPPVFQKSINHPKVSLPTLDFLLLLFQPL